MREYPMPSTLRDHIAVDIEPSSTLAWQNRVEVMRRCLLQADPRMEIARGYSCGDNGTSALSPSSTCDQR
jgi:hypothetical protein